MAARRMRGLAMLLATIFVALAARAVQLSLNGEAAQATPVAAKAGAELVTRADLTDRNGVLLATTLPSYVLAVAPTKDYSAADVGRLARVMPGLSREEIRKRLDGPGALVYLRRRLTASQRQTINDLGIPWVRFDVERRRVYPNGTLAAHALGYVNRSLEGVAGAERALDPLIRRAGEAGRPVRLSLDVRVQHVVESELDVAARAVRARGGAAIVLDGRTGEAIALASWPIFDPNEGGGASEGKRLSRATGAVFEMGSTVKPFTVAAGLDAEATAPDARFNLSAPVMVGATPIRDAYPHKMEIGLNEAIAYSSNQAMAAIALNMGAERLRDAFAVAGLFEPAPIQGIYSAAPVFEAKPSALETAAMAYGYSFSTTPIALAGAYTAFANGGRRVRPTLLRGEAGDPVESVPVFDAQNAAFTLDLMRNVVVEGTARDALSLRTLDIAGKTGTAEKTSPAGGYDPDRVLASFVAIFPASAPRYVILVALDEPERLAENGGLITGGALSAPVAGRIAARMGPILGLDLTAWRGDQRRAMLDGDLTP